LDSHGFRPVADPSRTIAGADLLLKRQTWNTNRAVALVSSPSTPEPLGPFLKVLRRRVAFRCGFFPVLYGVGVQVVLLAPGFRKAGVDPAGYVASIDNQWAIIQSLFLVDTVENSYASARSWGQVVTGKYQDAIAEVLSRHFRRTEE